jgi:uncharacterized protein YqhQ
MSDSSTAPGSAARSVGILIFTIGIALLVLVFVLAVMAFLQLPLIVASDRPAPQGIVTVLAVAAVRAVFLLVMAYVSSLLASKGLDLYAAAKVQR